MGCCHVGLIHPLDAQKIATEFTYTIARSFWQRLLGLRLSVSAQALVFPWCSSVQGFGLAREIQLVFLSEGWQVLEVHDGFGGYSVRSNPNARHVIEFKNRQALAVGDRVVLRANCRSDGPQGFSILESLLALPILIFLLFVLIQVGLLWHAKFALQHAVVVAARHASVSHGSDNSIRDGLVQGLAPLVGRSNSLSGIPSSVFRSGGELTEGLALGWLRWEVLSPTRQSFQDWGKPADRYLSPGAGAGEIEIPSAPLPALALRAIPASGVQRHLGNLPVGVVSEQTLLEANTLKLRLQFGVPLNMPIVGPLLARSLALWSGCGWLNSSRKETIGLVNYGHGANVSMLSPSIECRSLAARDLQGRWKPRWPIQVFASVAMQSNARRSIMALRDRDEIAKSMAR